MGYINNDNLTKSEHRVIEKFFDSYEDEDVIVADSYDEKYHVLPFQGARLAYQPNDFSWKSLEFSKRIVYDKQEYNVYLNLWRQCYSNRDPKCMTVRNFSITTPINYHVLPIPSNSRTAEKIVYRALDTFDERKIITPEQAYFERLYNVNKIPELIENHEWETISNGIDDIPILADELFIMDNPTVKEGEHKVDFGTILYQLIKYRERNYQGLSESDLRELDKLIFKLRNSDLLRLNLKESFGSSLVWPIDGMIESCTRREGYHSSELYSVENGRLNEEKKLLRKVIRPFYKK